MLLGKIDTHRQDRHPRPEGDLTHTPAASLQPMGVGIAGAFGENGQTLTVLQTPQASLANCLPIGFLLVLVQDRPAGVFPVGVNGIDSI